MSGPFSIRHNPLVVRAFRVGFRPGPTAFRFGIWASVLALIVLVVFAAERLHDDVDRKVAGRLLAAAMVFYTAASFLFGGLQRMLVSFSSERQRGTFEFLHLSTLRPSSVVWGFLWAGQLPGYLLLGLSLPVMIVGAILGGLHVGYLMLLVLLLAFYVLFLSVAFLKVGFWMKKASDIRGSLQVFAGIFMLILTLVSRQFPFLGILGGYPVLRSVWSRAAFGGGEGGEFAGTSVFFFDRPFPIELLAVVFLTPIGWVLARSLVYCLRNRELRPISRRHVLFLCMWIQLFTIGFLMNGIGPQVILVILGVGTLVYATWVGGFSVRETWRVRQRSSRCVRQGGAIGAVLRDPEGPPILLGVGLAVQSGILVLGYLMAERFRTQTSLPLWSAFTLVLPILLMFWVGQYLEFTRGPRVRKLLSYLSYFAFIWLPFLLFAALPALRQWPDVPYESIEPFRVLFLVSPLAQLYACVGFGGGFDNRGLVTTAVVQGLYLLLALWIWSRCRAHLGRLIKQAPPALAAADDSRADEHGEALDPTPPPSKWSDPEVR